MGDSLVSIRNRVAAIMVLAWGLAPHAAVAQGQYAEINGARIYYQVEGTGHALVLIHGWPMSARMWDEQARVLKNYYKVIRYDRRGFGRSPGTPGAEQSAERDAQDLEGLLRLLKVSSAYVLG